MRLTKLQREVLKTMARAGGVARAKALSPERRRQIARQGALARLRNIEAKAAQLENMQ